MKIGDPVYSVNPSNGALVQGKIKKIKSNNSKYYTVSNQNGGHVEATGEHPFLISENIQYDKVKDLLAEKNNHVQILNKENQLQSVPIKIEASNKSKKVFDLSIESQFNNFIANNFVVHNKKYIDEPAVITDLKIEKVFSDSVYFSWSVPDAPNEAPTLYTFSIVKETNKSDENAWKEIEVKFENVKIGQRLFYGIGSLEEKTSYLLKIKSKVEGHVYSPYSDNYQFSTK